MIRTSAWEYILADASAAESPACGNVDVAVGENFPVEAHVRAGAELQVDALAVEDSELEERHPRVLQHLSELGLRPPLTIHLGLDRVALDPPEQPGVGSGDEGL